MVQLHCSNNDAQSVIDLMDGTTLEFKCDIIMKVVVMWQDSASSHVAVVQLQVCLLHEMIVLL